MAWVSSLSLWNELRRKRRSLRWRNQGSTKFSREQDVGVKCR